MKSEAEWEARARELLLSGATGAHVHALDAIKGALRLGREMVEEVLKRREVSDRAWEAAVARAGDARAEEIAQAIESKNCWDTSGVGFRGAAARVARSTITKPRVTFPTTGETVKVSVEEVVRFTPETEAAIRADEREKIAQQIDGELYDDSRRETATQALCRLRNQLRGEPKTREQVLEEALRLARSVVVEHGLDWTRRKIDEALEWKP